MFAPLGKEATHLFQNGNNGTTFTARDGVGIETVFRDVEVERGEGYISKMTQGTHNC